MKVKRKKYANRTVNTFRTGELPWLQKEKNNTANTTEPVKTVINVVEKNCKLTVKPTVENF